MKPRLPFHPTKWILGLFWLVQACGASPLETADDATSARAAWQREGDDPLGARMAEIARRLEAEGLAADGPSGRGFLTAREQKTEALSIPAGRCATIVAVTSRGIRDLDATLFAPSGDVLAEDVEPDAHPTIQVCAPAEEARSLYYSLNSYDGAGSYLYVAFLGERRTFPAAARIVGGQPGIVSDSDDYSDQDVRLHELTQGIARRGFRSVGSPVPVPLVPDQRVRLPLRTELATCYTVFALAMPGLSDLNLRVLDDAGVEVASDDTANADASVQLCADRAADFAVEVHAKAGGGHARVAFFSGGQAAVGGESGLWLGERTLGRRAEADVDEAAAEEVAVAARAGWRAHERAEGALGSGGAVSRRVSLPGQRCTLLLATGGRGIGRLALRVVDHEGRTLIERDARSASASARLCPEAAADVSVQLVARRGEGRFVLTHLTKEVPADLEEASPVARGALLEAHERASDAGLRLAASELLTGKREDLRVGAGAGCVRFVGVATGDGGRVELSLHRGRDLVAREQGPSATVSSCDPRSELRLTVSPLAGDGRTRVMRFVP